MYDIVFVSRYSGNLVAYEKFKARHPNAIRLNSAATLASACAAAKKLCYTSMYWLVTDDIEVSDDFDFSWRSDDWDKKYVQVWKGREQQGTESTGYDRNEFSGIYLVPAAHKVTQQELDTGWLDDVKVIDTVAYSLRDYDVFVATWNQNKRSFKEFKKRYPAARLLTNARDVISATETAKELCDSEMFWLIMDYVKPGAGFDMSQRPDVWDRQYPHAWSSNRSGSDASGLYLIPRDYEINGDEQQQGSFKSIKLICDTHIDCVPADMFFISYDEAYADENWQLLSKRFPRAKRVHGITGIHNAHKRCAELSTTSMFWTIDADTVANSDFGFDYNPPDYDRQYLHIWHSMNPVNGLNYGWGAIKLWPTALIREFDGSWLDFTTTVGNIKMMPELAAVTSYNRDELSSWRSGFREAVKLCSNISRGDWLESLERLVVWTSTITDAPFSQDSVQGAIDGFEYYLSCAANRTFSDLKLINDFAWLGERFNTRDSSMIRSMGRSELTEKLRRINDV